MERFTSYDDDEDGDVPLEPVEEEGDTFELELEESHSYGRSSMIYLVFQTITLVLLPFYTAFFFLAAWACYLIFNPVSIVGASVSFIFPWLLYFGFKCAKDMRMEALRCYAFLLLLAVCLQISLCLVILLDSCDDMANCAYGAMTDDYLVNIATAARDLCYDAAALDAATEGRGSFLPYRSICACLSGAEGSSSGSWWEDVDLLQQNLGAALSRDQDRHLQEDLVCVADAMTKAQLTPYQVKVIMLMTLFVELALAALAYQMMVDLDSKAEKKAENAKGGPQIGTLRGTIIGAQDLQSGQHWVSKNKRKNNFSSRYAVLEVKNPNLANKFHRDQKVKTEEVEDDPSPIWNVDFDKIALYRDTKKFEIKVYDVIKGKHILCGRAGTHSKTRSPNGCRMDLEEGTLTDLDYIMNGNGSICIQLFNLNPKDKSIRVKAGQLEVRLQFAPTQAMVKKSVALVTETWYFEAAVLIMVFLAMIGLGLQSPASPPSPTLYSALRILELFVSTEMTMELLMEVEVHVSNGNKRFWTEKGFLFNAFVLFCNWLAILAPVQSSRMAVGAVDYVPGEGYQAERNGAKEIAAKLFSVGRVLRIVRPIRTFRLIKNVDIIVSVLTDSVPLFLTVVLLLVFLLAIFALVGVSSFGGALQYECMETDAYHYSIEHGKCTDAYQAAADRIGVDCPLPCPSSLECAVEGWKSGHESDDTFCAPLSTPRVVGYDKFGFRNFDNFWNGMMTTFVQTTGDGGLHTVPLALNAADAVGVSRSWILSFAVSLILNLVSLNLFLAVCCSAYSDVAERAHEVAAAEQKLKDAILEEQIRNETPEEAELRTARLRAEMEASKTNKQRVHEKDWVASGSCCASLRMGIKTVVLSEAFESLTTFVIVGNTITMAIVHKDMDKDLEEKLVVFELIFLACYIMEAILKLAASGSALYWGALENRFDLFVISTSTFGVIATFFEEVVQRAFGSSDYLGSVQSFRAVRLLRALQIVRLLNRQKALILVMKTIFQAWKPLLLHSIFCCFSMSVFSIIGMHMFGGSLLPHECLGEVCTLEDYERLLPEHFENFQTGLLTVFEMTVGEEWSHSMYWYMEHAGYRGMGYPTWVVELYFVCMYVWMNGILFSLYVAMLLENFSIPEEHKYPSQKKVFDRQRRKARQQMRKLKHSLLTATVNTSNRKGYVETGAGSTIHQLIHAAATADPTDSSTKSFYVFGLQNSFRMFCARVQEGKLFKKTIMTLIAFSCVSLAAEGRGDAGGMADDVPQLLGYSVFDWLNLTVLVAFAIEGTLKAIIHGFILKSGPTKPYLTSRMNQLDFMIIVLCSLSYLPFVPIAGPWARALRMGRVISPMMNLTKSPQIALVLLSFVRAAPDTAVVLLPLVLMGVVFSIVGVASFSGKLAYCAPLYDPLKVTAELLIDDELVPAAQDICLNHTDYDWVYPQLGFDSSVQGLATLLVAMTDGSHPFMLAFYKGAGRVATAFWVGFHLVFTCFFLNLFLGVLTASFEKSSGSALMTLGEKQWKASLRMLDSFSTSDKSQVEDVRPTKHTSCCRRRIPGWWLAIRTLCYTLANNEVLEAVFRNTIAANTATLASDMYPINHYHEAIVGNLNLLFLSICSFEVIIKMIGYGPAFFFSDGWSISDFVLVSSSLFLLFSGGQSGVEALRVMRVFRIIVLGSRIPALVALVDIIVECMKASFAVVLLTALAVYLYSIIGMNLFGALPTDDVFERFGINQTNPGCDIEEKPFSGCWRDLRRSDKLMSTVCPSCAALTDYTNFNNFGHSFRLLMQLAFGQGIGGFVADLNSLGADFWVAFAYFASFYMITVWVFMNLLIVTVLSNFDACNTSTHSHDPITPVDLEGFAHAWAALTIGVHRNKRIERTSPELLENLQAKLKEENESVDSILTPCFEDGYEGGSGQLAVRIEAVDGIKTEDSRPYCAVTILGTDNKGEETRLTRTVNTKNGTATFKPQLDARRKMRAALGLALPVPDEDDEEAFDDSIGETVLFHVTDFHTHCCIQVHDTFQFTDTLIGAVSIPFDEIIGVDGTRSCPLTIKEMTHGSNKGSHVLELWVKEDGEVKVLRSGEKDRWHRYEEAEDVDSESDGGDSDVEPDIPSVEADPDDQIDGEGEPKKEMTKEEKKEAKRLAKAQKKAEKAARKELKAKERAASGKRSWTEKLKFWERKETRQVQEEEDDDEEALSPEAYVDPWAALNPYDESKGWKKTRVRLNVTFEFQEQVHNVPTTGWIKDHKVRFAQMDASCGVEGWMELSEEFKPFKRRFCFIQDEPFPVFGFYRDAKNIDELERMSMNGKMRKQMIRGQNILLLCEGHDNKIHQRKNQRKRNFSIECEEEVEDGGKEEARIGILSGVIISASGLVSPEQDTKAKKAVHLCKVVRFASDDDDEDEDLEDADTGEDISSEDPSATGTAMFEFNKYPDQEEISPTRYMACHRTGYHMGCELDSEQVGVIHKGTIITVTHTRVADGILHLACSNGWLRANCERRNNIFMMAENCPNAHYLVLKNCTISADIRPSSAGIGTIKKHSVVEVYESQLDEDTGAMRFRVRSSGPVDSPFGWISELDFDHEATPDPYCVIEMVPDLPPGIEEIAAPPPGVKEAKKSRRRKKGSKAGDGSPIDPSGESLTDPGADGLPRANVSIGDTPRKQLDSELKRLTKRAAQKTKSKVCENNLSPEWNTKFKFNVFASCTKIRLEIIDEGPEDVMGFVEVELGSKGIPGPTLQTPLQPNLELAQDKLALVELPLTDAKGQTIGTLTLQLGYEELVPRDELVEKQKEARKTGGNLVVALLKTQTKSSVYRFQCPTLDHQRQWLSVLRWIADGAAMDRVPRRLHLPPTMLAPAAAERAERDISLVDLPFTRVAALLHGLYRRRVMGSHKPTLRRVAFTIFQLETHAWSSDAALVAKKDKRKVGYSDADGQYLVMLRGLNFNNCLERLVMLHYGKRRCLSYRQQVEEYEMEMQHLALQVLQTFVSHWVFRSRARNRRTVGGIEWPWHSGWRNHREIYFIACEAVAAQRIVTLKVLKGEVQRMSKPVKLNENLIESTLATSGNGNAGGQSPTDGTISPEAKKSGGLPCFRSKEDKRKLDRQKSMDGVAVLAESVDAIVTLNPVEDSDVSRRERITKAFNEVDTDRSGELREDEIRQVMATLTGVEQSPKELKLLMHELDKDGSGSVTLEEFIETIEDFDATGGGDDIDDDDDDLDEYGNEFDADPREQLLQAFDD
jgi:hypothetical protein